MDKILDLLSQLAAKLGQTVETLWPAVVRYEVIFAVSTMLANLIVAAIAYWAYKHIQNYQFNDDENAALTKGFAFAILVIITTITSVWFVAQIPIVLEPVGYVTRTLLTRLR